MPLAPIKDAIAALRRGEMIILVDDEDRENEGDLCMLADKVTPEAINFMARFGRGLICLTMTQERLDTLEIPMMVKSNGSRLGTAFTVSIEARTGVSTGISASDRARTIRVAVDPASGPADLISPGHIFPLAARSGGVLVRTGQTEGSVDLAMLSGASPAGIICEIMNDDGTMSRMQDLEIFAETHGLLIVTIAGLIEHRLATKGLVKEVATSPAPTRFDANFIAHVFRNVIDGSEHCAMTLGDLSGPDPVLVRVQSQSSLADAFQVRSVDDGAQLDAAMQQIANEGRGVLLYIGRPDRSFAWQVSELFQSKTLDPPTSEEEALNTPEPALRNFGIGAQCLRELGLERIRLLTNNPKKIVGLSAYGIEVTERVPLEIPEDSTNKEHLRRKREDEGHLLSSPS